jgi:hypothetical protein
LGYGVFNLNEKQGKLNLGISFTGAFETGVKWKTGIRTSFYTGVFADYGFNNMLSGDYSQKQLTEYNRIAPNRPTVNSVCVLTKRFSPLSFGIKLKFTFSVGCHELLTDSNAYKTLQLDENSNDDFFDNN